MEHPDSTHHEIRAYLKQEAENPAEVDVFPVSPTEARADQQAYTGPGWYFQTFPGYDTTGPFADEEAALQAARERSSANILPYSTPTDRGFLCTCEARQDDLFAVSNDGWLVCRRCHRAIRWSKEA